MKVKKYLITIAVTMNDGTLIYYNEFVSVPKLTAGILQGYTAAACNRTKSNPINAAITFIKELEG